VPAAPCLEGGDRLVQGVGRPQPIGARHDRLQPRGESLELVGGPGLGVGVGVVAAGTAQLTPTPEPEAEGASDVALTAASRCELRVHVTEPGVPLAERRAKWRPRAVDIVSAVVELRAGGEHDRDRPDHQEHGDDDREAPDPTSHHRES